MREPVTALIVAEPGRLRDAWRALLAAVPGISEVVLADGSAEARSLVSTRRPTLVLIDGDLQDGAAPGLVPLIKGLHPAAHCIILACCTGKEWHPAQLQADAVLVKGFPAARLFETVTRVLSDT